MSEPDDLVLVDRWRAGDANAGQALFARHFESISRFFETKCESEVDDLVQSTFLACLRAKHQFRKESSFRTYLFTIARHELYRVLGERQKHNARFDFELSSIAQLVTTPGTRLDRGKEYDRLCDAMRELPIAQQTVLELHYWEGMDFAELAEVFELEEAAIRTRLYRARKALREQLEQAGGLSGGSPPKELETLESMDEWARGLRRRTATAQAT